MDLRNIQTFVTVAQELNFAKAAHHLHLSQPSVTARIQSLEAEVGKTLFIRNRRNVQLSIEGEAFLPFALQMLEILGAAEEKMKSINKTIEGRISIGATAFISVYILPEILGMVHRRHPRVEFKVVTGSTMQINEMLHQNQIDIGLVSSTVTNKQVKQEMLNEYDLVLVCSPKHPFAQKEIIHMEELLSVPLVTYEQRSDAWKQIKRLYGHHDAVPNVVMELNQIEAAKAMVSASLCVCLLPKLSVERELREGSLVKVKVNELTAIKQKLSMIYLEKKGAYPLIDVMLKTFKNHFINYNWT